MNRPKKAEEFLSGKLKLWVNGEWKESISKRHTHTLDPGKGEAITDFTLGEPGDIANAVKAAREAFNKGDWSSLSLEDRASALEKFGKTIAKNENELAFLTSLDVGKPISQARGEAQNIVDSINYYAGLLKDFKLSRKADAQDSKALDVYRPLGVCGIINPWNFPTLLFGWSVIPAIAAGNTVVFKPAEDTPLTALYLAKLSKEELPDGVINVVTGYGQTAGAALSAHPDVDRISFTGSPEAGAAIGKACMSSDKFKYYSSEAGGKGAAVVFSDADVDLAANDITGALRDNSGQVCCDPTRLFIHESVYENFTEKLAKELESTKIGYGLDDPQMGPLVSEIQRKRVLGMINAGIKQGAKFILESGKAEVAEYPNGFYVKPALLTGNLDNICCTDEIFGPVAFVSKWSKEDQLVQDVNRSEYGLSNVVYSKDKEKAVEIGAKFRAGNLWVNGANLFPFGAHYAGIGKSGVHGGVNSLDCLLGYFRRTSVVFAKD